MTDNTHPDSGIITSSEVLAHYAETALMYEELRAAIDDGHESMTHADALAEIAAIRAENAALQQGYDAARLEIEALRGEVKEYRHGAGVQKALIETLLADKPEDALDAARYRMLRRGQHWSVINGVGDTLSSEELDAAIAAARAQAKEGGAA